jgi:hypothetical protein
MSLAFIYTTLIKLHFIHCDVVFYVTALERRYETAVLLNMHVAEFDILTIKLDKA